MNMSRPARITALALILVFVASLSAFAQAPCGCRYCQRFPEKECRIEGTTITCLDFLIVALCPPVGSATSADALSSEESFLAALAEPTQEPAE